MELVNESINITETAASGKTQTLAEGDVIVPDIKPDILKLLQVDAVSNITDKEVSEGSVSIEGKVDLRILYIPDNETDRIKSIIASFDYKDSIENKCIEADSAAIINTNVDRVEFSLINSRKLKVKTVVSFEYEIVNKKETNISVDVEGCDDIETQKECVSLQSCVDLSEHTFEVEDSIEIPSGQGSIKELLKLDMNISDTEYKAMSGKVIIKGDINVCALYNNTDGGVEYCETRIPFTEVLECTRISEECICDIDYDLCEKDVSIEEDSDGDLRIINLTAEITAKLKATEEMEIEMINDCYRPFTKTETEKEKIVLEEVISKPSAQNSVREIIETGAKLPPVSGVYNVITTPVVKKAEINGAKLLCEGYIEACVLYLSDSIENPVYSVKKEIPFSYLMDAQTEEADVTAKVKAEIKHTGYNLNAAGEVEIRCILLLSANIVRSRELEVIKNIEEGQQQREDGAGIIICFVQPGDTLWSIAKNYCVPQKAIIEFNDLKDDSLKCGTRLLIPGR